MTWVKICGMTNLEDALVAVEAEADAVGFVFYEKSPRNVNVDAARKIVEQLPAKMEKVGVFVDADCGEMRDAVSSAGLTAVQLHGRRSLESACQDARPVTESLGVLKVIPMIPGSRLSKTDGGVMINGSIREKLFAVLVDSQVNGVAGGTGVPFDWDATKEMIQGLGRSFPVIVAGGLNPSNAADALRTFQPFGLDVVSGVEASPGKKDPEKVRAFVRAVREYDRRVG